jgi:hypothetical protein
MADYIQYHEFRAFLSYLRQYFEYWVMFDRLDASDDRRISFDEFKLGLKFIREWGLEVSDPDAVFAEIDVDGRGMILFDEFANWAITHNLDLEDDDEVEEAPSLSAQGLYRGPTPHGDRTQRFQLRKAPPAQKQQPMLDLESDFTLESVSMSHVDDGQELHKSPTRLVALGIAPVQKMTPPSRPQARSTALASTNSARRAPASSEENGPPSMSVTVPLKEPDWERLRNLAQPRKPRVDAPNAGPVSVTAPLEVRSKRKGTGGKKSSSGRDGQSPWLGSQQSSAGKQSEKSPQQGLLSNGGPPSQTKMMPLVSSRFAAPESGSDEEYYA